MAAKAGHVLVIGAEGHQGSAVLRHLGDLGLQAQVLPDGRGEGESHGLPGHHAEPSSLDDKAALEEAFRGALGLFLVLDDPQAGPEERLRQGRTIADAAVAAGLRHVVYAAATGPDHHQVSCDRSGDVEDYFRSLQVPLTVLRPATVMEEIPWYWLSRYGSDLVLATPFEAKDRLPLIALDDVAALAATALARPDDFIGRTIDIAGDVSSPGAIAALLTAELRQPVAYSQVQVEGVFMYPSASSATSDIDWLRAVYPRLHTLRSWLEEGGGLGLCRRVVAGAA
jgi:uncharacterized protein YbjT (DUF2867 family)